MTNTVAKKKQLPAFLVLTIIALIAAIVLAATNAVTKGPIAEHAARARREAFGAVLQAHDYQEMEIPAGHDAVSALYKAVDENGNELGYTVVAAFKGYAGPVAVTLGVGPDGKVTGAVIGDNSFVETAGFGKRWQEETDRLEQFKQIDTVEGGSIEAIAGVTLTSNAVLNATNAAINCVNEVRGVDARDVVEKGAPKAPEAPKVELTGGIHEGSARGFASDVQVQLTMDDAGVVTGLAINSAGETPNYGTRTMTEPAFAEQFVGKAAPFTLGGNIEALSGATVTSTAVVEAVNMACAAPENPDAVPFGQESGEPEDEPAVETSAEPVPEGALVGTAKGFQSDVTVTLTVDENNVITDIKVDSANETAGFGTRCAEDEAFLAQFIGKTIPVEEFDALSGATVTSNAVVAAINAAAPATEPVPEGALVGTAKGFQSDVMVTLTVDENNAITDIKVNSANETPGFGTRCAEDEAFLAQFVGKTIPVEEFDALSGATVTSKAVVAAINAAAPAVETSGEPVPEEEMAAAARLEAFAAVLPANDYQEMEIPAGHDAVTALYKAVDENGNELGYTVVAAFKGYAGPVAVTLGVGRDGKVTGAVIGDNDFVETAGFGKRWQEETDRLEQFKQIDTVEGGSIEAISGVTVTSNAVLNATNAAINCVNEVRGVDARDVVEKGSPKAPEVPKAELTGGIHEGSAKGFASDVQVQLTMDDAGVVTGLAINSVGETENFGTRAMTEPAFAEQFVGKTAPFVAGENIDVLSGATVTSKAVIEAVNMACAAPENPDAVPFGQEAAEESVEEPAAEPVPEGALVGTAKGFQSDVTVTLTVDESNVITDIKVDSANETPGFGTRCAEDEAFLAQFIGKKATPDLGEGIEVLAGATVTSNAVVTAANAAIGVAEAVEIPAGEPADEAVDVGETVAELTGTAKGFQSDVTVTVSVDENGVITGVVIDSANETQGFGTRCAEEAAFAEQFIGKTIPVEEFDVLSGATVTSNAVVAAINAAAPAEEPADEAVDVGEPVAELTGTAKGFASDVTVTLTVDENKVITDIKVDSANETPGFGTRCAEDEAFLAQFIGKTIPVEEFDALSGATVTSNAVVAAINATAPAAEPVPEGALVGTAKGFQSDVTVTLTVDENNVITDIKVDSANETPGFGTRCAEDETFLTQFIGKKATPDLGEGIEALAGATVTSNAVVTAANAAIGVAEAVEIPAGEPADEAVAVGETVAELTGTAKGFQSDVTVTVSVDENGVITGVVIDSANETQGFGTRCAEDAAFAGQFIGKTIPVEEFDALSGATVTSKAVVAAINATVSAEEPVVEVPATPAPDAEVLTAKAEGFMDYVVVNVTLKEDGTIATLAIDVSNELPPMCDLVLADEFINQFIGKKGPFVVGEGIDVATGATFSSNGAINALNTLFPAEEPADEAPAAEVLTAKAEGFMDYVVVNVTLNEDGTIATLAIDVSNELPPMCDLVLADEFINQFIGKKGPFVVGEGIDVATGATFSSNGAINALNSLFPVQDMSVTGEEGPAAPAFVTKTAYDGKDITVTVTFAADGTVESLEVDASTQTPGLGKKCAEENFVSQFIGGTAPFVLGEGIDAVSYATVTSQAVVDAVNEAAGVAE